MKAPKMDTVVVEIDSVGVENIVIDSIPETIAP
jgi:hypothetical protein